MGLGMVERTQIRIKFVSFNTEDERPRQVRAAESGGEICTLACICSQSAYTLDYTFLLLSLNTHLKVPPRAMSWEPCGNHLPC